MFRENFDARIYNREAFRDLESIHKEIDEAKENQDTTPEELTKLYMKELNRSLFLSEPVTRNYKMYNPY